MKKHLINVVALLCLYMLAGIKKSEGTTIKGVLINNTQFSVIQVKQFGIGNFLVRTIPIEKETGKFLLEIPESVTAGIYRFQYSQTVWNGYVDVIINNKDSIIELMIDVGNDIPTAKFKGSKENESWWSYHQKLSRVIGEIESIDLFLRQYNKKDPLRKKAWKQREKNIHSCKKIKEEFVKKNDSPWLRALACYSNPTFVDPTQHFRLQLSEKHDKFWEGKPTEDTLVMNSPLYTEAILNYLNYYLDPGMEFLKEEQELGLKRSVDTIINRFSKNETMKIFAIKYLQLGFKEIGNEKLLQFIDENYAFPLNQCGKISDSLFEKRMANYATFKPGMLAPGKYLFDYYRTEKGIIDSVSTLLFFGQVGARIVWLNYRKWKNGLKIMKMLMFWQLV